MRGIGGVVRVLALGAAIAASGCGFTGDATARPGAWLVMNTLAEPGQLDPALVTAVEDQRLNLALFEGLVGYHPETLAPVPGVAEHWTRSEDGLEYRFRLRADARWSDGRTLDATDFVWSWRRVLTPPGREDPEIARPVASSYAELLFDIAGAEAFYRGELDDFAAVGIRAVSPRELVVRLARPTPWFLELLAFPTFSPVPRHVADRLGPTWTRAGNLVGNGAFVLAERRVGDLVRVERNPRYWDREAVGLDGIVYYTTDQIDTALDQYLAGETDWVRGFNPKKVRAWRADPELSRALRAPEYLGTYFYRLNCVRGPTRDPRVRRALSLAVDRGALTRHVTGLGEAPAHGLVPACLARTSPWTVLDAATGTGFDPERARSELAAAGFPGGRGFPTLTLAYNTDVKNRAIAEAVQQMWKRELGIAVELENREKRVHLALERALDYEISRGSWVGDFADPVTFLDFMVGGRANNRTGWENPRFDALVERSRAETDPEARRRLLQEAERILVVEDAALLPLFAFRTPSVLRPGRFVGIHENARDLHPPKYIRLAEAGR
ncbi:MAG: peptide ABC transporter substrate-binding protein [Planctomycetota bacterium]